MKEYQSIARSAENILELDLDEVPTLVEGIISKKGIAVLAGGSDLGKSYFLQQLSMSVASNAEEFLGFKLDISTPSVLYVSTEDDDYSMCVRLKQLKSFAKNNGLENLNFLFSSRDLLSTITKEINLKPVSLVVIDAFADVFRGNINDTTSVRAFMEPFKELAQEHECSILFNHHCGKHNQYKIPSKDNLLGSQGIEGCMRTVMEFRKDINDKSKRHLCVVKGNNVKEEDKEESFELIFDFKEGFSNTGNRCAFETLQQKKNGVMSKDLANKIFAMHQSGQSMRKISDSLKENDGIIVSKSTVSETLKKRPNDKLDPDNEKMI